VDEPGIFCSVGGRDDHNAPPLGQVYVSWQMKNTQKLIGEFLRDLGGNFELRQKMPWCQH
jgi:hypothetical protein